MSAGVGCATISAGIAMAEKAPEMTVKAIGTVRCLDRAPQWDELKTVSEVVADALVIQKREG